MPVLWERRFLHFHVSGSARKSLRGISRAVFVLNHSNLHGLIAQSSFILRVAQIDHINHVTATHVFQRRYAFIVLKAAHCGYLYVLPLSPHDLGAIVQVLP